MRTAVLGATGYVGARLVPRLIEAGHDVRAIGRSVAKLRARPWARDPRVELVEANALHPDTLGPALAGVDVLYYLVHSMGARGGDFEARDRRAATNVAQSAAIAKVGRIVYLGGLGEEGDVALSAHLRSRHEVAAMLAEGGVPVTTLRAAVILGSGSASYEILRNLVERLPVMIVPRWVRTPSQPISIRDVLSYLVAVADMDEAEGETYDIGGPEVVTYKELMAIYADEKGLRQRIMIPVPILTPRLSSYWIHLVTPAPASLARPLAEGLRNPVLVQDTRIQDKLKLHLATPREAIHRALHLESEGRIESRWTDAGALPAAALWEGDPAWTSHSVREDVQRVLLDAPPERVWDAIVRLGGETGYYYGDWLWRWRGRIDKWAGGVGLRRGRRDPSDLRVGDAVDFWRVVAVDPHHRLRLAAEMKLPGEAYLEFRLRSTEVGWTELTQTARFLPRGISGILYWHGIHPLHMLVFRGLIRGIGEAALGRRTPARRAFVHRGRRHT